MDFAPSDRATDFRQRLEAFMQEWVYPHEATFFDQVEASGERHHHPEVMEQLKHEARSQGLWNMFLPDSDHGAGLTNLEYAPLAELTGRSPLIAPEATNCAAPDTGNMEVLEMFGTPEQQQQWLHPLLEGEIRSAFFMTEPDVASSDARNIQSSIVRDGDSYVINGRKWWSTGAASPRCKVGIFMGLTDPEASPHRQQSMILVPTDAPGVEVVREVPVLGHYDGQGGHPEMRFTDVRVPAGNLIGDEGDGFMIAQARLGPGRIHHCMRAIGMAERALELLIDRALSRTTFGERLADRGKIRAWVAQARVRIEAARLLVLKAAWLMDTVGNKGARTEISAIKVLAPATAEYVIDKAIQVHGGAGVSDDFPLAMMHAMVRSMRIFDGPDEVHEMAIARREIRSRESARA